MSLRWVLRRAAHHVPVGSVVFGSPDRRIAGSPDRGEARARAIDGVRVRRQPLAYLIVRQLLFPLRGLPRKTAHGRVITLAVASAALIGAGVTAILG